MFGTFRKQRPSWKQHNIYQQVNEIDEGGQKV